MHKIVTNSLPIFLLAGIITAFAFKKAENYPTVTDIYPVPTENAPVFGYTHQRADGNRLVDGKGTLPESLILDIPLEGTPEWVVAVPYADKSLWALAMEDGQILAFWVDAQGAKAAPISPNQLVPGQAPLLRLEGNIPSLVNIPAGDLGSPTHPIEFHQSETLVFIHNDQSMAFSDLAGNIKASLSVDALPDARIISDESETILILSHPTSAYTHGVLGDQVEATSVTLIKPLPAPEVIQTISISANQVIEGIAPIWTDWDQDGAREIIITVSDAVQGAQLVVYNAHGYVVGTSTAIGLGYRWRHQIAIAPFGPNGEMELADVLTPHIGGIVEFFQWHGTHLKKVAQIGGFSSHRIGSRNLDMATAGDFNGDGRIELLVPNQEYSKLAGIQRTDSGAEVIYTLPVEGIITTNLGAVKLSNGKIAIAVGSENKLRIWYPSPKFE